MRSERAEPTAYAVAGRELPLSSEDLVALMVAVLGRGRPFRFKAKGCSMLPFICDGDVLTIAPLGRVPPSLGDVVAWARQGPHKVAVHRVVRARAGACCTQGDAVPRPDGWVAADDVLGRVIAVERGGRRVRWGLGEERRLIALFSRYGLWRFVLPLMRLARGARDAEDSACARTGEDE